MDERVLIALGGNAMSAADGSAAPEAQREAVEGAMDHVAGLISAGTQVVLTHGNGPQVGNLLIKNQLAVGVVPPVPLDWCGAQTQATIGVLVLNALERRIPGRVAALVTRTLVDLDDPAFADPVKPIGRYFPEPPGGWDPRREGREKQDDQAWRRYGDRGWRRVVASPEPLEVLDAPAVRVLADAGYVVVAAGGGGVPTTHDLHGVEAVIDKDLAATLLARAVGATTMVIATDVEHVMAGFGTADARPLGRTTPGELRALAKAGEFAPGSMGPKVEAACRFVEAGGRRAVITDLKHIAVESTGTIVEAE